MKREEDGISFSLLILYRILIVVILILVLGIAAGTAVTLMTKKALPQKTAGTASNLSLRGASAGTDDATAYFTGIGSVRAATSDENAATVIVSIAFPYDRSDTAFSEELAARTKDFRNIAVDLFSSYTSGELQKMGESALKDELLRRYNRILRLDHIRTLYFSEYLIID